MAYNTEQQAWAATTDGYATTPILPMLPKEGRQPVRCTADHLGVIVGAAGLQGVPDKSLWLACAQNIRAAAVVVQTAYMHWDMGGGPGGQVVRRGGGASTEGSAGATQKDQRRTEGMAVKIAAAPDNEVDDEDDRVRPRFDTTCLAGPAP